MPKLDKIPGFAPTDITDNRKQWEWETRYPSVAWKGIWFEAAYLAVSLFSAPILLFAFHNRKPQIIWALLSLPSQAAVEHYGLAWIGGMLGGTLYALKWLYHVVAHGWWNQERRLWRLFTPHISAGLAFAVIALVSSGLMRVFDTAALSKDSMIVGLAFLVGYFSDSAVAKLTEIASTIFGVAVSTEKHIPEHAKNPQGEEVSANNEVTDNQIQDGGGH